MHPDLPALLLRVALAGSIAIVLVLVLRRPLRARFGALAAYQAWAIVPAMMVMAALPPLRIVEPRVVAMLSNLPGSGAGAPLAVPQAAIWPQLLLAAWAVGALLMAATLVREQRRFVRSLGRLSPQGGVWVAESRREGPLLLGLWQPRLVLPRDFDERFTPSEQALIVAHENTHAARRDPEANALVAALQVCFWFNPLVHYAAPRFRLDQELACDATVMQEHPGTARAYAQAMLKSQMAEANTSAVCHWQSQHPLKERFMNLQHTSLHPVRRLAGRLAIATLVFASIGGTLAARAETAVSDKAARYLINLTMTVNGHTSHPALLVRDGEQFKVSSSEDKTNASWDMDLSLRADGDKLVYVNSKFAVNGQALGEPVFKAGFDENIKMHFVSPDGKSKLDMVMVIKPYKGT